MVRDEWNRVSDVLWSLRSGRISLCFWNNNHHKKHRGANQSGLRHCSLSAEGKKNPAWSLALSLFLTHKHTHTQSLLTVHIWRERMERVPYCPLSGDVGVCVRAWLLLVYIRVLNSSIALSIWARQIYLCCGSFMHLLFPKRIGMHSGREDR